MSLLQHFARQLQVHGVSPSQRVAVAVSGGSDSLALALLTAWWRGHGGIPEPLASIDAATALPFGAALAASPLKDLLHAAQALLQRRHGAPRPAASAPDTQHAPWQLQLQPDSQIASGYLASVAAAPEPAYAVIVDHALRPESAAEAAATAEVVAAWGLQPLLLTAQWPSGRPRHGQLMKTARLVRQRLFQQACRQHGIGDLLVAHQADDQAETFLIRLSRGSGIAGIASMMPAWQLKAGHPGDHVMTAAGTAGSTDVPLHGFTAQQVSSTGRSGCGSINAGSSSSSSSSSSHSQQHSIRVLRPLLGVGRSQLRALLRRCGVAWVEDPTNADTSYSRNAIRTLLQQPEQQQTPPPREASPEQHSGSLSHLSTAASNADAGALQAALDLSALQAADPAAPAVLHDILRLQQRCTAASAEMHRQSAALLAACAPHYLQLHRRPGTMALALRPLLAAPRSVAMSVLSAVLQAVSGAPASPKLQQVSRLLRLLRSDLPALQRLACGGCKIVACRGTRTEVVIVVPQQQQQHQRQTSAGAGGYRNHNRAAEQDTTPDSDSSTPG